MIKMKAYDLAVLLEKLKLQGLEVGEETAKALVKEVFAWVRESAVASATPIDDMVVGVLAPAESWIISQAEKINPADAPVS